MKRLEELTYFEILEIPIHASSFEIREAYREALAIYSEDSLSTYAFFDDEERKKVLDKIEAAYSTLVDEKRRAEYERRLVREGRIDASLSPRAGRLLSTGLDRRSKPVTTMKIGRPSWIRENLQART